MNARFWTWLNDGWVKLKLRPGEKRAWHKSERTDEGWNSLGIVWEHTVKFGVTEHTYSDGSDCDGRLSSESVLVCFYDGLHKRPAWNDLPILLPDWQECKRSQRDYTAERAGY